MSEEDFYNPEMTENRILTVEEFDLEAAVNALNSDNMALRDRAIQDMINHIIQLRDGSV